MTMGCSAAKPSKCPDMPAAVSDATIAVETPTPAVMTAAAMASEVVMLINAGDVEALFARFSPEMQQHVPLVSMQQIQAAILAARGRLTDITPIEVTEREGTFAVSAERGATAIKLQLSVDEDGQITALAFSEEPDTPPLARSAVPGLPFRGEWTVYWGGDQRDVNYHVDHPSQRRAADLVIRDSQGSSHRGNGQDLTDYYAYGMDILSMADGDVVSVIDGVPDSVPGELNPYFATGNFVLVHHEGTQVYSAYAHLSPGSIRVEVGDRVRRGQVLGKCGNSGNSSEPHLHVHLQDGPRIEASWGIEAVFNDVNVIRDGVSERRSEYSFRKGDKVSPPLSR
jgi:murein DD-endopeptidase MepM/ murein hydrolase activator NlpD